MAANTVAAATILPEQGSIEGDWDGAISVVGQTLPMSVHIVNGDAGLGATIDIQGATGIPLQNVSFGDANLHMELQAGPGIAVFDGEFADDSIGGTFTQAGMAGTFFLKRAQEEPAAPMEEAFRAGGHPDYTIETLPRANHLFIAATTGSPAEYATLPKEFVPELLPLMTDWILRRVAR